MKNKLILLFLSILFFECSDDSVSFMDYYYPERDRKKGAVYEFHAMDSYNNPKPESNIYHKIVPLGNEKWSITSLGVDRKAADSAVIKLVRDQVLVEAMFYPFEGKYYQSGERDQIFYPSELIIGNQTSKSFTYTIDDNPDFVRVGFNYSSKLVDMNDSTLVFQVESFYEEQKASSLHPVTMSWNTTLIYKKGFGLIEYISKMNGRETRFVRSGV